MKKPTDIDLAYAAGIIDGEGCITISRHTKTTRPAGHYYAMLVQVGMVDPEATFWLWQTFGGSLYHYKKYRENQQDGQGWTISANKAVPFLRAILPFLKIKQPQAEIALEFQEFKTSIRYGWNQHMLKPAELIQYEAFLAERLSELHGGKKVAPKPKEK